jgi:hypothetical protein
MEDLKSQIQQLGTIWLLEDKEIYIGIVNTFRDSSKGEV